MCVSLSLLHIWLCNRPLNLKCLTTKWTDLLNITGKFGSGKKNDGDAESVKFSKSLFSRPRHKSPESSTIPYAQALGPFDNGDSNSAGNAFQGGYGWGRYGIQNGYGANGFGVPSEPGPIESRDGAGGYGGLGSTADNANKA